MPPPDTMCDAEISHIFPPDVTSEEEEDVPARVLSADDKLLADAAGELYKTMGMRMRVGGLLHV